MPEERARDLSDALAEAAREADGVGGRHPSDDDLLDYRDGDLERAAEERVQDHLAGCRECAERFLDLDALSPEPRPAEGEGADGPADLEVAAMWRRLRAGGATGGATAQAPGPPARRAEADRAGSHRAVRALAAGLTVAVLGLGVWVTQLRREVDRLAAPRVNAAVLYLDEPVRALAPPALAAPADGDAVLLIVTPPGEGDASAYEAVLAADGRGEIWRGGGFRLTESGTLRVRLPSRFLRPGGYELRLTAPGDAAARARYRFTVLPEARGPT